MSVYKKKRTTWNKTQKTKEVQQAFKEDFFFKNIFESAFVFNQPKVPRSRCIKNEKQQFQ